MLNLGAINKRQISGAKLRALDLNRPRLTRHFRSMAAMADIPTALFLAYVVGELARLTSAMDVSLYENSHGVGQ